MRKTMLAGAMFLASLSVAKGSLEERDRRVLEAVQGVPAQAIDRMLPQQPLGAWFDDLNADPAKPVEWEINDCGEQTGTPADAGRDFPMCVAVSFKHTDVSTAYVVLAVGTFKQGLLGTPQLRWGSVRWPWGPEEIKRLAELLPMAGGRPGK